LIPADNTASSAGRGFFHAAQSVDERKELFGGWGQPTEMAHPLKSVREQSVGIA